MDESRKALGPGSVVVGPPSLRRKEYTVLVRVSHDVQFNQVLTLQYRPFMRCSRPLPDAHPELLIIETSGLGREFRVENEPLSCGQRGRTTGSFPWLTGFDAFTVMLLGVLWTSVRHPPTICS